MASITSLINALPDFSGNEDENVSLFVKNISDICDLKPEVWSDQKKIILLRLHCKGKAEQFLSEDPVASNEKSFENLTNILINKFKRKENFQTISNEFANVVQKPRQTVQQLAEEIQKLAHKFIENPSKIPDMDQLRSNLMFSRFLEALRSDIKQEVLKFGTKSFQEAVNKAIHIEKALEENTFTVQAMTAAQNVDIQLLLQQQLENSKMIKELADTVKKLKDKGNTCHICAKNHLTTDCWQFPSTSGNSRSRQPDFPNRFQRGRGRGTFRPYRQRSPFRRGLNQ